MKKKIVFYETDHVTSNQVIKRFAEGIHHLDNNYCVQLENINSYLRNGFPSNTDFICVFGILNGTGLALKEAYSSKINTLYFDHSYFDAGYKGDLWTRIILNNQNMNYIKNVSCDRFQKLTNKIDLKSWKINSKRGKNILIVPPTHAIGWFYEEYNWLENVIKVLIRNLGEKIIERLVIRKKPNEPIVDKRGFLRGFSKEKSNIPIEEELRNSYLVISFNSNVALKAVLEGIPVIVNQSNCCYPISFKLSDLIKDVNNPIFNNEPERDKLIKWLCYCQFKLEEVHYGKAWEIIKKFQMT